MLDKKLTIVWLRVAFGYTLSEFVNFLHLSSGLVPYFQPNWHKALFYVWSNEGICLLLEVIIK